jgi:hypothetical protein
VHVRSFYWQQLTRSLTVLAAYRNAAALVKRIREKKEAAQGASSLDESLKDLEDSLTLGPPVIQGQYDHDLKRFGEAYACGDSQAREQMKDVLITLQITVLSSLQGVWIDDAELDYAALQSASDDSRVNVVVSLGQLSQRISAAAVANAMLPEHNMPYPAGSDRMPLSPSLHYSSSRSTRSTETQPLTPGPISERFAQMSLGQFDQKSMFAGSITSRYSANSNVQAIYPQRRPNPRFEPELIPPALGVHRLSNDSIEGLRRPSSHTLAPEDSVLLASAPAQPPQLTNPPSSELGDELDRASFVAGYTNNHGQEPSELSRTSSGAHSITSRDRYGPDDYNDLAYTRGGLDDPNLNYSAIYSGRNISPTVRRPSYTPSQHSTYSSNHSTLEHVAYLQSNARPPATDTYQISQQPRSPPPQVNQPAFPPPPERRPVPYRVHEATQPTPLSPQLHEREPSLASGFHPSERKSSLAASKPPSASLPAPPIPDRIARSSVSAPIPVTSDRQARPVSTSTTSSVIPAPSVGLRSPNSMSPTTANPTPALGLGLAHSNPLSQPQSHAPFTLVLPTENNLHGFCKGAVKLQINPNLPKKAFSAANRPAGLTGTIPYFQCSKCSFEGPAVMAVNLGSKKSKAEKTFDSRVRVAENGIRYRWVFLAKSHVQCKSMPEGPTARDGSFGAFGCIFCCAEGAGRGWGALGRGGTAPTFGNISSFMEHLQMHQREEATPSAQMQAKTKCIVGRVAETTEDFEINLPPPS